MTKKAGRNGYKMTRYTSTIGMLLHDVIKVRYFHHPFLGRERNSIHCHQLAHIIDSEARVTLGDNCVACEITFYWQNVVRRSSFRKEQRDATTPLHR